MIVIYADEFVKQFEKLPREIQQLYSKQESIFKQNWRDPRLHVKKLKNNALPFSFRITRRYRVLFTFIPDNMVLFATIGHRKESYRK